MSSYLLSPHISDLAKVTTSGSVGGAGPANVTKGRPSLHWRSDTDTPHLVLDLNAAEGVDSMALGWINGQSGDTFRLRGATTEVNLTVAPTYDSGNVAVWPAGSDLSDYALFHRHFELDQLYTLQWWRVDFDFSGNTHGYTRVSRVVLGERIEFANPISFPVGFTITEPVVESIDYGGEESARPRGVKRSTLINASWGTESEFRSVQRLMLRRGSSGDLVAVTQKDNDVSHAELTYIGRVKEPMPTSLTQEGRWGMVFSIHEAAPLEMAA